MDSDVPSVDAVVKTYLQDRIVELVGQFVDNGEPAKIIPNSAFGRGLCLDFGLDLNEAEAVEQNVHEMLDSGILTATRYIKVTSVAVRAGKSHSTPMKSGFVELTVGR